MKMFSVRQILLLNVGQIQFERLQLNCSTKLRHTVTLVLNYATEIALLTINAWDVR